MKANFDDTTDTYNKIVCMYDFADELIQTVEKASSSDPEAQLAFVEPLVKQVEDATDILAEEYRYFAETGKKPTRGRRKKIEESLSQLYLVLDKCKQIEQLKK